MKKITLTKKQLIIILLNAVLLALAILLIVFFAGRASEITLQADTAEMQTGDTLKIQANIQPAHAFNKSLRFVSDNESVALVDSAGVVSAFAPGNAVISITAADGSNASTSLWIKVRSSNSEIKILTEATEIPVGSNLQIAYRVVPKDSQTSFSLNNPAIASISNTGILSAQNPGVVTVKAQAGNSSDEVEISITEKSTQPTKKAQSSGSGNSATIALAGGIVCSHAQRTSAASGDTFNFSPAFSQVTEILSNANYAIAQLTPPIAPSFPYSAPEPSTGLPLYNAPAAFASAIASAGIDSVATASGHCCDMGSHGILETLQSLKTAGISPTGTFDEQSTPRYALANVNGIKLGILSYSEFFNGKEALLSAAERKYMTNLFSPEKVKTDTAAAKAAGADFIIAYISWNANGPEVSQAQKNSAQAMADAGVDVIAGSYPPMPQTAEYLSKADGGTTLCLYSLGNLISETKDEQNTDSIIVNLALEKTEDGVRLKSASYTPCRVFSEYDGAGYVAVPIADSGSQAAMRIASAVGTELAADISGGKTDQWENGSYLIQED